MFLPPVDPPPPRPVPESRPSPEPAPTTKAALPPASPPPPPPARSVQSGGGATASASTPPAPAPTNEPVPATTPEPVRAASPSDTTEPVPEPPKPPPAPPDRLAQLRAAAVICWMACGLAVVSLEIQHLKGTQHYEPLAFLLPLLAQGGATLIALGLVGWNVAKGRKPVASIFWGAVALVPAFLWISTGVHALGNWSERRVPDTFRMNLAKRAGASLMEAQAAWLYPERHESARVVMFHRGVTDPAGDLFTMEAHLTRMEEALGRPIATRIHWVRGPLLGQENFSIYGLAAGTPQPDEEGSVYIAGVDFHEAGHAALSQLVAPRSDVPTVLSEGWAQCQSLGHFGPRPPREAEIHADYLALVGSDDPPPPVAELLSPAWYHQDSGPVYQVGPFLVRHLITRHGPEDFLKLCSSLRADRVDAVFREVYGQTPAEIEAEMRREAAAAPRPGAPALSPRPPAAKP